ncbi:hypothetical protein NEOC95_000276 [Neochlamydia sp. AcF95]|nr:hypothetical protein [Neochlamydia sp. AcF95]
MRVGSKKLSHLSLQHGMAHDLRGQQQIKVGINFN